MSEKSTERPASLSTLAVLVFMSGGCALAFQIVWIRELRLVFGATTSASAAVLAIFMAGLGIGNALFGKHIDRSKRPIRIYGYLEGGIAISAGCTPILIDLARQFYFNLGGQSSLGLASATVLRLVASAIILSIPTVLMGGTMPVAARAVAIDADPKRRRVAMLYGLNTLGAVAGAWLATFWMIEWVGNRGLLWSACCGNLFIFAAATRYSKHLTSIPDRSAAMQTGRQPIPEKLPPVKAGSDSGSWYEGRLGFVCLASALVGFVFFLMELVWYRMLGPLLGGTTYTFGMILCVALLGIGVGGNLYTLLGRLSRPSWRLFSVTCALEAFLIAFPFWYGDGIALWTLDQQMKMVDTFRQQVWDWFEVGTFVIFPASVVAGFQFPLLVALAGTGRQDVAKHVGWIFAANTAGAICGSLAGGFFLLPMLTAPGLWRASILILVVLGGVAAMLAGKRFAPMTAMSLALSGLAMFAALGEGPTAVWRHSGIGAGRAQRQGIGGNSEREFRNSRRRQCIWEAEGVESSVAITATDSLAFIINGKSDGNAYCDAGTQIGLGLLGPLLHKSPNRGLVIGLGTGESAGWMADCEGMQRVDVVELEPAIVEMTKRCSALNRNVLANTKTRLNFNDAREFLLTSDDDYDIIVSEPSNPYRAGIANLYTQEFYRAVSRRLAADGLFLQWLQAYEVDERTVAIVLKTLRSVFPETEVWRTKSRDMVLVSGKSQSSISHHRESLKTRAGQGVVAEGLGRAWRVRDISGVLAHFVCGNETVDQWIADKDESINSDNRNLLEYAFAKSVGQSTRFSMDQFSELANRIGDRFPFPVSNDLEQKTFQRTLALHLHLGGVLPEQNELPEGQRIRREAYAHYRAGRYADAANGLAKIQVDLSCPIERVLYAHTLAETRAEIPSELLQSVREENESEALAISSIAHLRREETAEALIDGCQAFRKLNASPWGSAYVLDRLLRYMLDLSYTNKQAARQLFNELREPFSMFRMEEKRLLTRYLISENLDNKSVVEALAALEPNVPWTQWLLERRAGAYAAQNHPLSSLANSELQSFLLTQ